MKENVTFAFDPDAKYPSPDNYFRPSIAYPEYLFESEISDQENSIYNLLRNALFLYGLDRDNYGTKKWNPLSKFITAGSTVLLKPNMVMHKNDSGNGEECLYTHPSVTAAIIDYVCIALYSNGCISGKIIVADAPMQDCDFKKLIENSGYKKLIEFYLKHDIDISLVDLRNVSTVTESGLRKSTILGNNGIVIDLGDKSKFTSFSHKKAKRLRITNYDPNDLLSHHNNTKHEYCIAAEALAADVIINIPKPKTHRKAGVTISQKNLIGINCSKEYLPHHTNGSVKSGGDCYSKKNIFLCISNKFLDYRNVCFKHKRFAAAKFNSLLFRVFSKFGHKLLNEKYSEGSWYGNDTIWRTIKDINYIIKYADKNGVIKDEVQRTQIIIADMVIAGEGEGPLLPSPHYLGTIGFCTNLEVFDKAAASIMGIDYNYIPSIKTSSASSVNIISNNNDWNKKDLNELLKTADSFIMTEGWRNYKNVKKN